MRAFGFGFEPVVLPLLAIRPIAQSATDLQGVGALAFTSSNGVTAFAALTPDRSLPVFTVGDATAEAARAEGFAIIRSAAGAIADLARLLTADAPRTGTVLVPGAQEPAGDLPAMLSGQIGVRLLPVYLSLRTEAAAPANFDTVTVHSPRAGVALAALGPFAGQTVLAISEAAAAPLTHTAGLNIRVASRPDEAALFEALGNPVRRV